MIMIHLKSKLSIMLVEGSENSRNKYKRKNMESKAKMDRAKKEPIVSEARHHGMFALEIIDDLYIHYMLFYCRI